MMLEAESPSPAAGEDSPDDGTAATIAENEPRSDAAMV